MHHPFLLAAALVLALSSSACSAVDSPAATVSGTEISDDAFMKELEAIRDNNQLENPPDAAGDGPGSFNTDFAAEVLTLQVYYKLIDEALEELNVEISEDELLAQRELLTTPDASGAVQISEEALTAFPGDYQQVFLRRPASLPKLGEALARDYYDEHAEDFASLCLSHILVPTLEQATELATEIEEGALFAELASEFSEDTTSAVEGGELECGSADRFVAPFAAAATALEVGEVSDPVETEFGFHLITLTEETVARFEDVADQAGEAALSDFVTVESCSDDISVNPRYGTWDTSPCSDGGLGRVEPPTPPGADPADPST